MNELIIKREGPFLWISLNRPERRNALTPELVQKIESALDTDARVVILKGEGKAFCAGADLTVFSDLERAQELGNSLASLLIKLYQLPIPTIAMVHGAVMAGGCGIMSACDFVIASRETLIGCPEVKRGLVAAIVMTLLQRNIGEKNLKAFLLSGDSIWAERAVQMGMIDHAVSKDQLHNTVIKRAKALLESAPKAVEKTKDLFSGSFQKKVEEALKEHHKMYQSDEAKEGIRAFFEKRPPEWSVE